MTNEEMRIAIAESVGFTDVRRENAGEFGGLRGDNPEGLRIIISSYCRDLNAIQEVVRNMNGWLLISFLNNLVETTRKNQGKSRDGAAGVDIILAPASDWAEAYLRTLGLYTE